MKYEIVSTAYFDKKFQKLRKTNMQITDKVIRVFELLQINPLHPSLHSHLVITSLFGKVWSSRVTGDLRILWKYDEKGRLLILVLNIGGHSGKNSVYK